MIGYSIQEYGRKINSILSIYDILSLVVLCIVLAGFTVYIGNIRTNISIPLSYTSFSLSEIDQVTLDTLQTNNTRPFASKHGKTYTFAWCGGSSRIATKNKIYFQSETEAKNSGRTLSKLCKK